MNHKGTKAQRHKGTKAQRLKGSKAQGSRNEPQRHKDTKAQGSRLKAQLPITHYPLPITHYPLPSQNLCYFFREGGGFNGFGNYPGNAHFGKFGSIAGQHPRG
jgi:hypothetical protein